jgi:hypothetical protein
VEDRLSEHEDKIDIKSKTEELLEGSKGTKGVHKISVTPSKGQTCKSQALEKEKRCKPRG